MITTRSSFYYGHTVADNTNKIDFKEGAGSELTATLNNGSYSISEYAVEVKRALDDAGSQVYSVSIDRVTREITISSSNAFTLLFSTGTNQAISAKVLLGHTTDTASALSHKGSASGSVYKPQRVLQDFLDKNDNNNSISGKINESASGVVEAFSFGNKRLYEMNIDFINDYVFENNHLESNSTGVQDIRDFMEYAINKGNFEFMPDRDTPSVFDKVNLESTQSSSNGLGYRIYEMYSKGLVGYYETKKIKLRVL